MVMQNDEYVKLQESTSEIMRRWCGRANVGIILGTGLGALADRIEQETVIPYSEIPHFPISTVESHAGRLILGRLEGKSIVAMQGRFHYYEGYSAREIAYPVRVMKELGASTLIVSNAAGGLNPQFRAGDVMIIEDHINLLGVNPLIGPNDNRLGERFPDMSEPYSKELIALARKVALQNAIPTQMGVYVSVPGPNLETRAEYRYLRMIGADAVGMSTVPEVIVAAHAKMRTLGISVITDMGLPDALEPASLERILKNAAEAEPKMNQIIQGVLKQI